MVEVVRAELTREQIEALGQKLNQLGQDLSDSERNALLAIFGLAEQAIAEHGFDQTRAAPPPGLASAPAPDEPVRDVREIPFSLSDGFDSIFQSGLGAGMDTGADSGQVSVQVGWQK